MRLTGGVYVDLLFLTLIKSVGVGFCEYASLSLSADKTQKPIAINNSYCAIYNPTYTRLPIKRLPDTDDFHRAFFLSDSNQFDPFGCEDLHRPVERNQGFVVDRGNCTFYEKALVAQKANASLLLVVYDQAMVNSVPNLTSAYPGDPSIDIPVLLVSNVTGEDIKSNWNDSTVYLSVFIPYSPPVDPGSALLFCIAVGTVLVASFLANTPFLFLRYGLLNRKGQVLPSKPAEDNSGGRKTTVVTMIIGLVVMLMSTCALLLLLYFFYSPMVYIVLALYCVASVCGLYSLLSPFVALIPLGDKCRLPAEKFDKIPVLKYRPNILFPITVLFSVGVVLWWAVERHSVYAWILQDILGFSFITLLLSRLKFLKPWFVAVLMMMLFVYDIFMVFITPYFTHDGISVMEKAATGPGDGGAQEMLPVVFLVPKLIYPTPIEALCSEYVKSRPASLLGYGDVGIPALLVTLCLKFDFQFGRSRYFKMYYATSAIAYTVGLAITYTALTLMKTAQPALLYLVPSTLGSVTLLSLARKEFTLFFTNKLPNSDSSEQRSSSPRIPPPNDVTHHVTETDTDCDDHMTHDERKGLFNNSENDTAI